MYQCRERCTAKGSPAWPSLKPDLSVLASYVLVGELVVFPLDIQGSRSPWVEAFLFSLFLSPEGGSRCGSLGCGLWAVGCVAVTLQPWLFVSLC